MKQASVAYYAGSPIMTDAEFDALEARYGQMIEGDGDIKHVYRMYSQQKHYDRDGAYPFPVDDSVVASDKLDGLAMDLLYINGSFTQALTRGNGIKGRDVTDNVTMLYFPKTLGEDVPPVVQITGEVMASNLVENPRNFAAGAINSKDQDEFLEKMLEGNITFVAYGIQCREEGQGINDTYAKDMLALRRKGFDTILEFKTDGFPTDGIVYRINDNNRFNQMGFTDKFPRGAFAHKEEGESVVTELLDVVWNTGKSGKVTPVAILEPVMIGEALVSRATLNNMAYIEALELELGCSVEVVRAGEIIPKIVGRVD